MCCLNWTLTYALYFFWSCDVMDLSGVDCYNENPGWTCYHISTFPFVLLFIPLTFLYDIIAFPFHLINIFIRRCAGIYSPHYLIEAAICGPFKNTLVTNKTTNITNATYTNNSYYNDLNV